MLLAYANIHLCASLFVDAMIAWRPGMGTVRNAISVEIRNVCRVEGRISPGEALVWDSGSRFSRWARTAERYADLDHGQ